MKEVFTVTSYEKNGEKKSFWCKIGTAFENKDGSLSVNLNALPTNGKLVIQEKKEWDNKKFESQVKTDGGASDGDIPF